MQEKSGRIEYIDLLKGIAIILMIVGHTFKTQNVLFRIIYSFHMPLFAIISGYFFKKRDFKERINGIMQRMFMPYIYTWMAIILIYMVKNICLGNKLFTNLLGIILNVMFASATNINIMGIEASHCGPVWFLIALGIAMLVFNSYVEQKYAYL